VDQNLPPAADCSSRRILHYSLTPKGHKQVYHRLI
jgi:hypothetical protein